MGKGLALKHIRSDNHFITQTEIFLQENATLAEISRFVQPENFPPTSLAAKYHSLCVYLQVQVWKGESRLGPHLHPHNLGWKAVEDKRLPVQCDMDVAPKALLKVVRCNCKIGCDTLRCSCRKAGLDCSTGCGECRGNCVFNCHFGFCRGKTMFARLDFSTFLVCCSGDLSDNESEEKPSVAICGGSIGILTGLQWWEHQVLEWDNYLEPFPVHLYLDFHLTTYNIR